MKVYKSKIGLELLVPLLGILGMAAYRVISAADWLGMLIISLAMAFSGYVLLTISYRITGTTLIVKCGVLIHETIEIGDITQLRQTYNPTSAPAASLNRLEITHSKGFVLVSPKDKQTFISDLLAINPAIRIASRTTGLANNSTY